PLRRNLNSQRAAVWTGIDTPGGMNSARRGNGWPISGKAGFRMRILARTATELRLLLAASRQTSSDFTTWLATSGNGAPIGIGMITTERFLLDNSRLGIHKARRTATTRQSPG